MSQRRFPALLALVAAAATVVVLAAAEPAAAAVAAPWCGTTATADRPATVAGQQIRVVYAYPSDGVDRSAELAPAISGDVDAIRSWWEGQDPTRTPRFDLVAFACGPQVDLTVVRLSEPGARLIGFDTRADRIFDDLTDASSPYLTFLVYFDGPIERADVCGQGGGEVAEGGYALVYLQACGGPVDARVVAAHELGHALGAIAIEGPPNACDDDTGHPCDSTSDLMYPTIGTDDLFALTLDVGRDDYYGHAGSWDDVQDSPFLRWNDRQVTLDVAPVGNGRIASDIVGISCARRCTTEWNSGSKPTLYALPAKGYRVVRWTGACSRATGTACSLTLSSDTTTTAVFAVASHRLTLSIGGKGRVTSRPSRLACPSRCTALFDSFEPVRLAAAPAKGWRLRAWGGACKGARPVCVVPMTKATSARAVFVRRA